MESSVPSGLSSLLSASSYPLPEPLTQQRPLESDEDLPLYGGYCGLSVGTVESELQIVGTPGPSEPTTWGHRNFQRDDERTVSVAKKRGRPRKSNTTDELPVERRRAQIRQAQRAYRSRKEEALSRNEARIAQLEAALETMNTTILSFGQHLAQTGVLASDSNLESHLRRTIETCKHLIGESNSTARKDRPHTSIRNGELLLPSHRFSEQERAAPSSPSCGQRTHLLDKSSPLTTVTLRDSPMPLNNGSPLLFDTTSISVVELPVFIRQLRLACAYHAYFTLRNHSFTLNDLRRKFRFLLSMLSREDLTSYFEASLQARLYPARMNVWQEIPFFSVGGAGTHYPPSSSSSPISANPTQSPQNQGPVREDPLSGFSRDIQENMDGKWFDIRDLEGFLATREIYLLTGSPHMTGQESLRQGAINASSLIRNLVTTCICLGRSPGWRPLDVERALRMALWA